MGSGCPDSAYIREAFSHTLHSFFEGSWSGQLAMMPDHGRVCPAPSTKRKKVSWQGDLYGLVLQEPTRLDRRNDRVPRPMPGVSFRRAVRSWRCGAGPANGTSQFLATCGELHGLDPDPAVESKPLARQCEDSAGTRFHSTIKSFRCVRVQLELRMSRKHPRTG